MQAATTLTKDRREAERRAQAHRGGENADGGGRPVWRTWLTRLTIVAALALTTFLLYRTLRNYTLAEIEAALLSIPLTRLALAGAFAASSYACLTLFDTLAIRYVDHRVPYPKVAFTSFVSLSIGHSLGLAGLSSGAIRYRYYSRWGLTLQEVAKVILFTGTTVGLGLMVLAGIALVVRPELMAEMTQMSTGLVRWVGALCLALGAGYVGLAATVRKPLHIRGWRFQMPTWRLAVAQIVVGPVNFALVAACLYQLILGVAEVPYFSVVAAYVSANVATLITHVPGGLGVIETVVLYLVPGAKVIGSVVAFRVIYFLIPLAIGGTVFLVTEVVLRSRRSR